MENSFEINPQTVTVPNTPVDLSVIASSSLSEIGGVRAIMRHAGVTSGEEYPMVRDFEYDRAGFADLSRWTFPYRGFLARGENKFHLTAYNHTGNYSPTTWVATVVKENFEMSVDRESLNSTAWTLTLEGICNDRCATISSAEVINAGRQIASASERQVNIREFLAGRGWQWRVVFPFPRGGNFQRGDQVTIKFKFSRNPAIVDCLTRTASEQIEQTLVYNLMLNLADSIDLETR